MSYPDEENLMETLTPELELLADYECVVGEGPLWSPTERLVYWTDIETGRLFRWDYMTGLHEQIYNGDPVGGFTLQSDGSLLLFKSRGTVQVWRDGTLTTLIEEIPDDRETLFNDVIADPQGRVFCGMQPSPNRPGRLYRLDPDLSLHVVDEGFGCPNGMGFTLDCKQMYFTDSIPGHIYRYDYDETTGALSNRQIFASVPESDGLPDGMTVDTEGGIWSARWDGNTLVRYAPDGTLTHRIDFPVRKVSSVTFGGDDYTEMFVTTAGGNEKATDGKDAGSIYRLRTAFKGLPEFVSRIAI